MKKLHSFLPFLAILFFLSSFFLSLPNINDLRKKVVMIKAPKAQGSGVFVAPNLIITCKHVIRNAIKPKGEHKEVTVIIEKERIKGKIIKFTQGEGDLALIQVEGNYPFVRIETQVKVGQKIITVGAPFGFEDTVTWGRVANITDDKIVIDAKIASGASGGGVFNNNGNLIAIIQIGWRVMYHGDWLGGAIPAKKIQEFLEDIEI